MADTAKIYAGVCVGGPLAGKRWTHTAPQFCVEELPDGNDIHGKSVRVWYDHSSVGGVHCWTPRDWSMRQALKELVKGYHAKADSCVCGKSTN